jgi:hypothetical protein
MPLLGFKFNLIRIVKGIVRETIVCIATMYGSDAQSSAWSGRRSARFMPQFRTLPNVGRNPVAPRRRCYNRVGFCTNGANPAVADAEPADDPLEPCCKFKGFSLSAKPYIIHCKLAQIILRLLQRQRPSVVGTQMHLHLSPDL